MRAPTRVISTLTLALLLAGCGILDVKPVNEFDESQAITSAGGARSALAGLYDALQDDSYYGGDFTFFGDLSADDVEHTGTFTSYREVDLNDLKPTNPSIEAVWNSLYFTIGRANILILKVPDVADLLPDERDQILGEAYFIRALTYHNLVKLWGEPAGMGVPLVLVPPADIPSAANVTRASTAEVYTQILADLQESENRLTASGDVGGSHRVNLGAVHALRARVFLYQGNYAGAETEAQTVAGMGYDLAGNYADLFDAGDIDTPEDIFKLTFDEKDFQYLGYYYLSNDAGGRREVTPPLSFAHEYAPADVRGQRNISFDDVSDSSGTIYGSKWTTGIGAEDLHIIRYGEVVLIQAEAEARQNKLVEAEATLTPLRTRAGLGAAGLDGMTQAAAIDTIIHERMLEMAYEGDRWPDLVRTGKAVATMGLAAKAYQVLYPIPLKERDVTVPPLPQNPGY